LIRFSAKYNFEKPNDKRALDLMNDAAKAVMTEISDITIAYGVSDEFRFDYTDEEKDILLTESSFIFHKSSTLFERRARQVDANGCLIARV
jgi:tRNA(His) guanylyltransferase